MLYKKTIMPEMIKKIVAKIWESREMKIRIEIHI